MGKSRPKQTKRKIIMKKILLFLSLLLSQKLMAQSTEITPGTILPKMTTTQRTGLAAPADGMLVFDSNIQSYWYRQSGSWVELPKSGSTSNYWSLTGAGGNEIKNTNSGGFWSANPTFVSLAATDLTNPHTAPISGAGTRMMWIPSRSAFRVGSVDGNKWDAANIGLFSFASGFNNSASGAFSTAMGINTTANGDGSTAMGYATSANGNNSIALGFNTNANGNYSVSMGISTIASREGASAIGKFNIDNSAAIFLIGNGIDQNSKKNIFTVRGDNDRVGIGTDDPIAHLHVQGAGAVTTSQSSYFYPNSTSLADFPSSTANLSIFANNGIVSATYIGAALNVVASDARIKNIVGRTNNASDLVTIAKLKITDYRMRDEGTWGKQAFKKVIAQEVEEVFPNAVSKQTSAIPDIYALAESVTYNAIKKELTLSMSESYNLKIGDIIELVHPTKGKIRSSISSVNNNTFTVKNWLENTDKIFVFGRVVDDFRVVDYEALSMLGISAIQQLIKENETLKSELQEVKKGCEIQFKTNVSLEANQREIFSRLEKLEKSNNLLPQAIKLEN